LKETKHNSKNSPSKTSDISEIERKVDRILLNNKNKLEDKNWNKEHLSDKIENFDFDKFSPIKRKKESIYFVKDKKKKVEKEEPTSSKSSDNPKKTEEKSDSLKVKKHIGFGKKSRTDRLAKRKSGKKAFKTDKGKKSPKKLISEIEQPSRQIDSEIGQLSSEEAEWLDQRIKRGYVAKHDKTKKIQTPDEVVKAKILQEDEKVQPPEKIDKTEEIKELETSPIQPARPEPIDVEKPKEEVDTKKKTELFSLGGYTVKTSKRVKKTIGDEESKIEELEEIKTEEMPVYEATEEPYVADEKTRKRFLQRLRRKKKLSEPEKTIAERELKKADKETREPEITTKEDLGPPSFEVPAEVRDDISLEEEFETSTPATSPQDVKLDDIPPDNIIQFTNEANRLKSVTLKNLGYSKGKFEEIDYYSLHEPFAYVQIIRETETLDKRYILVEVELYEQELKILEFIKETLGGFRLKAEELESKGEKKLLIEEIDQVIEEYMLEVDPDSKKKIVYFLEKQFLGLEMLNPLMRDPNIEDISCDGAGVPIFLYHRRFGSLKSNLEFEDEELLSAFVIKLAQKCGKHISIAEPMLDATMPDGSRIQMTLSTEITTKGSTFTIRKFKEDPFSPPDLIEFNSMSSEMVAYMWMAVENGINALIAGGTAAGKTSTLNALSLFIPRESKIVSIEETRELNLPHPNWIPGVSRSGFGDVVGDKVVGEIDLYDLMKAALRQRPEYILVGEIRGREAYVLFQAMATGHTTYSTVHADSAQSLIHRLEGKPINIPRIMLQALDIVCIQVISRVKNKRARRVKQVIEIIDIDPTTKEILTNEVFRWDPIEDKFVYSGKSYVMERIRGEKDLSREDIIEEIKNRAKLLEWMNKNNIREFKKVSTIIAQYYENPAKIMKKIKD